MTAIFGVKELQNSFIIRNETYLDISNRLGVVYRWVGQADWQWFFSNSAI